MESEEELAAKEKELLEQAKKGEHDAFGKIVLLYQGRLRAYAARYVGSSADVFDLVQDAFLDAFQHLDRFDSSREFGPWIRTICCNRILNYFRSRKVRKSVSLSIIDEAIEDKMTSTSNTADQENLEEKVEALKECINDLKEDQRELIELRYQSGVAVKDIAEVYGQSAASISMRLMRIRETLKKSVEKRLKGG